VRWWALRIVVAAVFAFLLLPIVMTVLSSVASSSVLAFPPRGFTLRWYEQIAPDYIQALKISLVVAVGTTVIATLVGGPAALAIARGRFFGRRLLNAFCLSPLMVPTLVIGIAGFQFLVRASDLVGLTIAGTVVGVIIAQSAFTIPFVVRAVIAGQAHFDHSLEEAAWSLGTPPLETFRRVTLPLLAPGLASGAIFAFIMSLDDVPIAMFVGGGDATTLPVKIFTSIEFSLSADIMAIATLIVAISLVLMLALDWLVGLDKFFGVTRR
jgi:putative spermidine/putrescine transport system permease protein